MLEYHALNLRKRACTSTIACIVEGALLWGPVLTKPTVQVRPYFSGSLNMMTSFIPDLGTEFEQNKKCDPIKPSHGLGIQNKKFERKQ